MIDKSWQRLNADQKLEWLLNEVLRNASHTIDLGNRMDERFAAVDSKLRRVGDEVAVLNAEIKETA